MKNNNTGIPMISHPFIIVLFFLLIICSLPVVNSLDIVQKIMAQTNTTSSTYSEGAKVLVDDAIQALKNKDINSALVHLNVLNQQLSALGNSSSVQSVKVLVYDTNLALKSGDINKAVVHLNLVKQQLGPSSSIGNNIAATTPSPASSQINKVQANHPPQAYNVLFQATTGLPIRFVLSASNSENENVTFSIISEPSHGMITNFSRDDGFVTYAPTPGYIGTDSFSFQVTDNHNQASNIAHVSITVRPKPTESTTTPSEQSTPQSITPPSQIEKGSNPNITPFVPSRPSEGSQGNGIDWMGMCNKVQLALYQSCDTLVNSSDGSLTSEGERAFGCISNGALLALGALGLGLPPGAIIGGLGFLAAPTGCDGIVKMDQLGSIGDLSSLSKTLSNALGLGR